MQNMETSSIQYQNQEISFQIIRSQRKTLEIAVLPNQSIQITAPIHASLSNLNEKVKNRILWIQEQQQYFKQFETKQSCTQKQYMGGETHLFLGKPYLLKLLNQAKKKINLKRKILEVSNPSLDPNAIRTQILQWHRQQAQLIFNQILMEKAKQFQIQNLPEIQIRQMKTRWGSLSKKGKMTLNLKLIHVPKACIEYVITHELCHQEHPKHNQAFYQLLSERMKNWAELKLKLEKF
jgi:predicted metal-dependent hydrolase